MLFIKKQTRGQQLLKPEILSDVLLGHQHSARMLTFMMNWLLQQGSCRKPSHAISNLFCWLNFHLFFRNSCGLLSNTFSSDNSLVLTHSGFFLQFPSGPKGVPQVKNGCSEKETKALLLLLPPNQETEKKHPDLFWHNVYGRGMSSNNRLYTR